MSLGSTAQGLLEHAGKLVTMVKRNRAWNHFLEQALVRIGMLESNIAGSSALVLDKRKDETDPSLFDFTLQDL